MTSSAFQEPMSGTARYEHTATRWSVNRGDNTKYKEKK